MWTRKKWHGIAAWNIAVVAVVLCGGAVAAAHGGETHTSEQEAAAHRAASAQQQCERRTKMITTTMRRMAERSQKHLQTFETIAERTEHFYIKQGKAAANYAIIAEQVKIKYHTAESAVATLKTYNEVFTCNAQDPAATVQQFRQQQKTVIAALKAYKDAVKSLITEVKTVQENN